MAKKKRRKKKAPDRRSRSRRDYGHDHATDDNFVNDLDHAAYHLVEDLRRMTNQWSKQGFVAVGFQHLPEKVHPMLKSDKDWKRLASYIDRWMVRWLRKDFPMPMVYGQVKVSLTSFDGKISAVVFGYELQSEASKN